MAKNTRKPISPDLHSRGVVSCSPYLRELPTPGGPPPGEFLERWVKPFYMKLLGGQSEALFSPLREVLPELTPPIVDKLLAALGWRERLTGSWFAALKGWEQFEDRIGELLLRSEVCYAGKGYCLTLASFATSGAIEHLTRYLDFYLRHPECWYDQEDAMAALLWLDQQQGSDRASPFLPLWLAFIADKPNWGPLDSSVAFFGKQMDTLAQIRAAVG